MSYHATNSKTVAKQARSRSRMRAWRPTLAELCALGAPSGDKQPTTTKRGPGRVHTPGYSKRKARIAARIAAGIPA